MDEATKLYLDEALANVLKGALKELKKDLTTQMSASIAPINERLAQYEMTTAPQEKVDPSVTTTPETAALLERLQRMEKVEQERVVELQKLKFDGALNKLLGNHSPIHGDMVRELLANRYNKAIEKNGEWYLPNGSKLSEEVEGFFSSDAGRHFVANPAGQTLDSHLSSKVSATSKSSKEISSDDMLQDWIL